MYCGLHGIISNIFEDSISVKVGGINYLVQIAESLIETLSVGRNVEIILETRFKVDKIVLFGFLNVFQQFCFNAVGGISGVNDRVALNVSGYFSPNELIETVQNLDANKKFKISGVGAKTWEKIIFSLQRNKSFVKECSKFAFSNNASDNADSSTNFTKSLSESEATEALISIGINKHRAVDLVMEARRNLDKSNITTEELVRLALSFYSKVN